MWPELTLAGTPGEAIATIGDFRDGTQSPTRVGDVELTEWFEVTQGLQKRCMLSLLLFNIFFAGALETVLMRFSEDRIVLKDISGRGNVERDGETSGTLIKSGVGDAICCIVFFAVTGPKKHT